MTCNTGEQKLGASYSSFQSSVEIKVIRQLLSFGFGFGFATV